MNEQALFFLQLSCHRDAQACLIPGEAVSIAMHASEQLMNKCADMCYEWHTVPERRADSLLSQKIGLTEPDGAAERCLRTVAITSTGAAYQEAHCEDHVVAEALECGLIAVAQANGELEEAWQQVESQWLTELDALTNARYMRADEVGRKAVTAERVSFGNWLQARKALLEKNYPDSPEVVGEVIAEIIRACVLSLCEE